jgi:hypothetical protein
MRKAVALMMGLLALAIGMSLLVVAANFFSADSDLAAKGGRAEGSVTEIEEYRVAGGKRMYRPHVGFIDAAGQRRTFVSNLGSNPASYARGDKVTVIYDPANPARAEIDSFLARYLGTLVFGAFGAVFATLGAVMLFRLVR